LGRQGNNNNNNNNDVVVIPSGMQSSPAGGQQQITDHPQAEKQANQEKTSIFVVSRGSDPPVWTIVNSSTQMKSAVNVITGNRITHGHQLLLG
jgi:hypothetical protein